MLQSWTQLLVLWLLYTAWQVVRTCPLLVIDYFSAAGQNPSLASLVCTDRSPALRLCSPQRASERSWILANRSRSLDSATWDLTLFPANPPKHSCGLQSCLEKSITSQTWLWFSFVSKYSYSIAVGLYKMCVSLLSITSSFNISFFP